MSDKNNPDGYHAPEPECDWLDEQVAGTLYEGPKELYFQLTPVNVLIGVN